MTDDNAKPEAGAQQDKPGHETDKVKDKPAGTVDPGQPQPAARPDLASDLLNAREARSTGEKHVPSSDEIKQRKRRSLAIAGAILLFMVLVYAITVLRIGAAAGA